MAMMFPELSAVVVQHQLEQVSELATARYNYTNMGQYEDSADFHGIRVPYSGKRFIVSYDGSVLARVDLKDSEVNITGRRIPVYSAGGTYSLPSDRRRDSVRYIDERSKNIFNQLTIENCDMISMRSSQSVDEKPALWQGGFFRRREGTGGAGGSSDSRSGGGKQR